MSDDSEPKHGGATLHDRLSNVEANTARMARLLANHSLQFDKLTAGLREDLAQIHGALLAIDGGVSRIEGRKPASNGEGIVSGVIATKPTRGDESSAVIVLPRRIIVKRRHLVAVVGWIAALASGILHLIRSLPHGGHP
jgi:hypothetical protein